MRRCDQPRRQRRARLNARVPNAPVAGSARAAPVRIRDRARRSPLRAYGRMTRPSGRRGDSRPKPCVLGRSAMPHRALLAPSRADAAMLWPCRVPPSGAIADPFGPIQHNRADRQHGKEKPKQRPKPQRAPVFCHRHDQTPPWGTVRSCPSCSGSDSRQRSAMI